MKQKTHKICKCGRKFKLYRTTQKYCSATCEKLFKGENTKIKKVAEKTIPLLKTYSEERKKYLLENPFCFICGKPATTIEHRKGRKGKDENGVPMLIAKQYWAACCLECNLQLENDPELSEKHQLSKNHSEGKGFLK